jgi:hypothetical protein
MLEDVAVLTGSQLICEELGIKLENVTLEMLGKAKKVVITKEDTTIVNGAGKKADIQGRISQLKAQTRPKFAARMIRGCSSRPVKTKAPRKPERSQNASGSDLGRLDLQKLAGARDWDGPRLHRLRNLAHEVDV